MAGEKRQQRAAATQQQLLVAARAVFAERGYQAASVAAITDAASTAHGTFYLYFKNKEDAFIQVMSEALDDLYDHAFVPFDQLGPQFSLDKNRQRIAAFVTTFVAHGRVWRALLEAVLVSPTIEARWMGLRARFHQQLSDRFRLYQSRGELRELDTDLAAYTLAGMLEWLMFTKVAFDTSGPVEDPEALIDLVADLWVHALGLTPPEPGA